MDLAYLKVNKIYGTLYTRHPKIAVEVLIGHGECNIIAETSVHFDDDEINKIVCRICENAFIEINYKEVPQDEILASNQKELHCGDNGIFKGVKTSNEERELTRVVQAIYDKYPYDGKYIICDNEITACQSNCKELPIKTETFNPLGYWTGGIDVDSGATNRKLGSDMGRAVTGGGLHGKDLTKADVSVNIFCHRWAQDKGVETQAICAIGNKKVRFYYFNGESNVFDDRDFEIVVRNAAKYIQEIGGFEKLAEWGLIR